jgi:CRISPR-associated protein Csm4
MALHLVKMKFTSPLHLARGRVDYSESLDRLHSDTLKSALFIAAKMFYETEITQDQTGGDAPTNPFLNAFTVSSAFPFYGEELFFPRPVADFKTEKDLKKKVKKKISYFGKSLFEKWRNDEVYLIEAKHLYQENKYASIDLGKEDIEVIKEDSYQHVTIMRASDGNTNKEENRFNPYYTERLYFHENAGLFFLIDIKDERFLKILKVAVDILGDEGIGTDRSTGNGQFTPTWKSFEWENVEDAKHCMNLSLFCPSEQDFNDGTLVDKGSAFSLVRRGGYLASPCDMHDATLRKKPVYFFEEGSTFSIPTQPLQGKLMDVSPKAMKGNHPVYREGRALFIPVKLPKINSHE